MSAPPVGSFSSIGSLPTIVRNYGSEGMKTISKMVEVLEAHSLTLSYDAISKQFIVKSKNSKVSKEFIEEILTKKEYQGWIPTVLDKTDALGNRIIKLQGAHAPQPSLESVIKEEEKKDSSTF